MFDSKAENLIFGIADLEKPSNDQASKDEAISSKEFSQLYRDNKNLVRSVIFQITGGEALDDLVQETFIQIWKGLPQFRQDSKLSSWIYKISVNRALDHLRVQKRQSLSKLPQSEGMSLSQAPEEQFSNRDLVSKGLQELSEDHRTVLILSMMHDLANGEISEILEISEGTVKSRLHYAKLEFRKFLLAHGVNL